VRHKETNQRKAALQLGLRLSSRSTARAAAAKTRFAQTIPAFFRFPALRSAALQWDKTPEVETLIFLFGPARRCRKSRIRLFRHGGFFFNTLPPTLSRKGRGSSFIRRSMFSVQCSTFRFLPFYSSIYHVWVLFPLP